MSAVTTECPFSDEEREWIETRVREIANESSSGLELDLADLDISEDAEDDPGECPDCGSEKVRELGSEEAFCPYC